MSLGFFLFVLGASLLWGEDLHCPAYPSSQRQAHRARLELERSAWQLAQRRRASAPLRPAAAVSFIDDRLFSRMAADGVEPAPASSDTEFLRRIRLDLTGRIPAPEEVERFTRDAGPGKRAALIDALLASPEFVDYWTLWFGNLFEVTSAYYNLIGIPGRNRFHQFLRDFVERDLPYTEAATALITATGDSHETGPPNFVMRGIQFSEPIQDTWDEITNKITTSFLGVQTQCVSCHNGRDHLEPINLYLSRKRREDFYRQAAFVSRMSILEVPVDARNQQRKGILFDRAAGAYHVVLVDPNNPGVRPARRGGPYSAAYMFSGDTPRSEAWRAELARLLTEDRQFARATVNYLWAHFFRAGIVDPPNGWDLARISPDNPPPAPWTLQPSHPELLEELADEFIAVGYRIRPIIRRMVESNAYQLSSRYPGAWRPEYALYFARQTPRRLSAEELYDAVTAATATAAPMFVEGFPNPLWRATQLPDPTEPRNEPEIQVFLRTFGRGDWWRTPRSAAANVVQALYLMNDLMVNYRTFGWTERNGNSRVAQLAASNASDEEAVKQLFLAGLGRTPTPEETASAIRAKKGTREVWLSDIQWVVLNKVEFLFNF
ncbi:MAG: DUF1553 domain-containing protein [Acidobacteria bacterium]|nr:DUF1553 domain-containing protein [Acidobacteriota bacterium]MBI3470520.1 DUF1553 domain-containing protein [Candidatus Solibacter usitatus]